MSGPTPPRWATRLLEAALPRTANAEALLGDLHEEFVGRLPRGRWNARAWYTQQALGIALRYWVRSMTWEGHRGPPGARDTRGWEGFMDRLAFNVRYSLRRLARTPGFTLVAILSLALGIGANTALFSIVNAIAIRDLPFEDSEALVNVYGRAVGDGMGAMSYPDYADLAEGAADVFEGVSGTQYAFMQAEGEDGGLDLLLGETSTGNYFTLTGVQPVVGRLIGPEDQTAAGGDPGVVLGDALGARRYD